MATRDQIIAEAREWKDTRFRHQGRLKGVITDCAGVILGVGKACGAMPADAEASGYSRYPQPLIMRGHLERLLDHVHKEDVLPGDVLWLRAGEHPQHLAIYVGVNASGRDSMIHAPLDDQVRETPLENEWREKIVAVYRFRNLTE